MPTEPPLSLPPVSIAQFKRHEMDVGAHHRPGQVWAAPSVDGWTGDLPRTGGSQAQAGIKIATILSGEQLQFFGRELVSNWRGNGWRIALHRGDGSVTVPTSDVSWTCTLGSRSLGLSGVTQTDNLPGSALLRTANMGDLASRPYSGSCYNASDSPIDLWVLFPDELLPAAPSSYLQWVQSIID